MIEINSYVRHKQTGKKGKVFGYGYKIVEGTYWTTLKVELLEEESLRDLVKMFIPNGFLVKLKQCRSYEGFK